MGTHGLPLSKAGGFSDGDLARRGWPFLALLVLGFAVIPLPPVSGSPHETIAAGALLIVVVLGAVAAPWNRMPEAFQVLPMLCCLALVALLRDSEGGAISAVGPMAMVPVFWCALYGNRAQLGVVLGGVTAIYVLPAALIGAPRYPVTEWERAALWTASGLVFGLAVQDLVTRMRVQSHKLAELARTDALTGLPNRRVWDEALVRETARARRLGETLCVALLDVDDFKRLIDIHGQPASDRFLKKLATVWSVHLRGIDVLVRLGGDEFGLLFPDLSLEEAESVLARLQKLVPNDQAVSAGLVATDGEERPDDVFSRADRALQDAKRGRHARGVARDRMPAG